MTVKYCYQLIVLAYRRVVSSKGLIFSMLYVTGETYVEYHLLSLDFHYFQNIKEMQAIQKRAIEII